MGSKTVRKNSKTWIANKGMNGVIGMRVPVTTNQIAIKDAERQKKGRPIKEKEMVSTDQRYRLAVKVLLEGFQHTLNR